MAIASILLADKLSTKLIFKDQRLKIEDVKDWITSAKEVDVAIRAYDWTINWIGQNINKFKEDNLIETWGKIATDKDEIRKFAYINKKVYTSELTKAGFDFDSIKKKLKTNGMLVSGKNQYDKATRINESIVKCIQIILPNEEETEEDHQQELPF